MTTPFIIAPYSTGLEKDLDPWMLPEDAFPTLEDAVVWRGRLRKRFGFELIGDSFLESKLRISVGTTDANGDLSGTVPGAIFKAGQMFSLGSTLLTVVTASGVPAAMLTTGTPTTGTTGTFDSSNGNFVITGGADMQNPNTEVFFYPSEPVMGIRTRESTNINLEDVIVFDTQFAYQRSSGAWANLASAFPPPAAATWTGSDSQFFWSVNGRGANPYDLNFYTVNFNRADNIRYIPTGSSTWTNFRPQLNPGATRFLDSCKILLFYQDRMIALNTLETDGGNQAFPNRCRFSQSGDPINSTTSWDDVTPGRGGFIDAPTSEAIITADFIKDRLIVYFERSTWQLVYTGASAIPFRWLQINNELGAESTFSLIGFDQQILGVGNVGIHGCNSINVQRIDQKIPDEVFNIHNGNQGPERVYGIRDYSKELVYWTFPDSVPDEAGDRKFPNKILIYNYQNSSWAFFKDTFTCFGYFQRADDRIWSEMDMIWESLGDTWVNPNLQSAFPDIAAGNQQGVVALLDLDKTSNDQFYYITNMTTATQRMTIVDHNFVDGDCFKIEDAQGITLFQDDDENDITTFQVVVIDSDTISIDYSTQPIFGWTGTYTGGGLLKRLSGIDIRTKPFNFGTSQAKENRFPFIDFLLDRTTDGEISVDYYVDENRSQSLQEQAVPNVLLGSNVLLTQEENNNTYQTTTTKNWHRYFLTAEGDFIQLRFFLSGDQCRNELLAESDFILHAMIIHASLEGRLVEG